MHSKLLLAGPALLLCGLLTSCETDTMDSHNTELTFSISYDASLSDTPQDGRLLLALATYDKDEPRFLVGERPSERVAPQLDARRAFDEHHHR